MTWGGAPTFTNVICADNNAGQYGGCGYLGEAYTPTFTNVVVHGNHAGSRGGAFYFSSNSSASLTNVSMTANEATTGGAVHCSDCFATFENTNAWGNTPDEYVGIVDPTGNNGNISFDPKYLDVSAATPKFWDFHLSATSPLVDAGEASILDPDGGPSDIGAYGGPGAELWDLDGDGYPLWWQPGPYDSSVYPGEGWDCDDLDATVYPGSGC